MPYLIRQFNFLPRRSTVAQLLNVLAEWIETLDNGTHVILLLHESL